MAKRRYSDEDRAEALAILDACGGNFSQASRESGVPRPTIQEWVAGRVPDTVPELRQEKKAALDQQFSDFAARVLHLTTDEDIQAASLKDRLTAAGIAVDKRQLLRGQPTEITKTDGTLSARIDHLASAFEGEVDRQAQGYLSSNGVGELLDTRADTPEDNGQTGTVPHL